MISRRLFLAQSATLTYSSATGANALTLVQERAGKTDDENLASAISDAQSAGESFVFLKSRRYTLNRPVSVPSGIQIVGQGFSRQIGAPARGTIITRSGDFPMFIVKGVSLNDGGPLLDGNGFFNIMFDGEKTTGDILQMQSVVGCTIEDCFFRSARQARWILLAEVFDSWINRCQFEWGGTADGALPGIDFISGVGGLGYTNEIFITNCRFESFLGTAIGSSIGENTNEIWIRDCKFESIFSSHPAISLSNCVALRLDVRVFSKAQLDIEISSQIQLRNCSFVKGTIFCQHRGNNVSLNTFVMARDCNNIDLEILPYGGASVTSGYSVIFEGGESDTFRVNQTTKRLKAALIK